MRQLFKKVFRELWQHKARSVLAILALFIGMAGFSTMLFSYTMLVREIPAVFERINPHSAILKLDAVDRDVLEIVEKSSAAAEYDVMAEYSLRVRTAENEFNHMSLYAYEDIEQVKINKVYRQEAKFSPAKNEVVMERLATSEAKDEIGDTITIQKQDGSTYDLILVGTIHDISVVPANMHHDVYSYVSFETLRSIGYEPNILKIIVSGEKYDRTNILNKIDTLVNELEDKGHTVKEVRVPEYPGKNPHQGEYNQVGFVLQIAAFILYLLGCLIIVNLVVTILGSQTKQIGVLKAIGAKTSHIFSTYIGMILVLAVIALAITVPVAIKAGMKLTEFFLAMGNFDVIDSTIPVYAFTILTGICFVLPFIISFLPILRSCRITVHQALNDHGVSSSDNAKGRITGILHHLGIFSTNTVLAIRNVFKNIPRVVVSILILTIGGAIFLSTMITIDSVKKTMADNMQPYKYQYELIFSTAQTKEDATELVSQLEAVKDYEEWGSLRAAIINNGKKGDIYSIKAIKGMSKMYQPVVTEGEWVDKLEGNKIVVGVPFFKKEEQYKLGDTIEFKIGTKTFQFEIGGVIEQVGLPVLYMNKSYYDKVFNKAGLVKNVVLTVDESKIPKADPHAMVDPFAAILEAKLAEKKMNIMNLLVVKEYFEVMEEHYIFTLTFFLITAVIVILVGGIGLASTMSIQVMEKTKEFGIIKAIGGSNGKVFGMVMTECLSISTVCFLTASALSILLGFLSNSVFGIIMIKMPFTFSVNWSNYLTWFIMLYTITLAASLIPARKATKITVRETLSYE